MKERLQKVLANLGFGSRREIEGWISEGRIKVNGEVAELGCQIDGTESVHLDDRRISIDKSEQERRVLIYYKPVGEITTRHDPEGRPTIFESLPSIRDGRWITVGRLDINTQGLLLVTNDGELAHRLMHPSHELEREYAVRVIGEFTDEMADNMRNGIEFEDGVSKFEEILWSGGTGANFWYHVTVKGGKNREVRRLWESQGLMVSRLIRIRYGNVELPPGLREGQFIDIDPEVLKELVESVGLEHQHVVLDEKQERQRTKARRIGSVQERRRELSRSPRPRSDKRSDRGERSNFGRSNDRFERRNSSDRPDNRGDRTNRGDRGERSNFGRSNDRFERRNSSDRPDNRGDRTNRGERNDRGERSNFGRSNDRFERRNSSDRPDNRGDRTNRSERSDRGERSNFGRSNDRFERRNSSDRPDNRGDRTNRGERSDRGERSNFGRSDNRGQRDERDNRSFGSQDSRRHNRSETRSFNRDRNEGQRGAGRGRDSGRDFKRDGNRDSDRRSRS
ncbi:pseudouridine synthase [Ignatzschineria indica]|uniref:23S rRNA pseudouridine(2605) synthase RluB n=1 Tax=Ignatzschineria indica TaxID=472583 RepID=UPI002577883F|nr:pseudouridine synthase [Ignatzschineria indica]MDM1545487.1 pseudouridine synthase [Ignatzschineria indica]